MMPCRWLDKAERDLKAAKILLDNGLCGESTFHSQQAAEKTLKAVLAGLKVQPPKTHQLEYLMILIEREGVDTQEVRKASLLSDYAVEARYPNFGEEPTCSEAEEAITLAEHVIEWARRTLEERGIKC